MPFWDPKIPRLVRPRHPSFKVFPSSWLRRAQDGPRWAQDSPRWAQDGSRKPEMSPRHPKMRWKRLRMIPRGTPDGPRWAQNAKNNPKMAHTPKLCQRGPNIAQERCFQESYLDELGHVFRIHVRNCVATGYPAGPFGSLSRCHYRHYNMSQKWFQDTVGKTRFVWGCRNGTRWLEILSAKEKQHLDEQSLCGHWMMYLEHWRNTFEGQAESRKLSLIKCSVRTKKRIKC